MKKTAILRIIITSSIIVAPLLGEQQQGTEEVLHAVAVCTTSIDPNTYTPQGFNTPTSNDPYRVHHRKAELDGQPCHIFVKHKKDDKLRPQAINAAKAVGDSTDMKFAAQESSKAAPQPKGVQRVAEYKVICTNQKFTPTSAEQFLQGSLLLETSEGEEVNLPGRQDRCFVLGLFDAKATNNQKNLAGKQVFFTTADTIEELTENLPELVPSESGASDSYE